MPGTNAAPAPDAPAPYLGGPGARVPSLDGLRGIAILLVMLHHFGWWLRGDDRLSAALVRVASAGWCGVDLFFVLSGFLITGILCDARGLPGYFRVFYARRALRIFPLYYGVTLVCLGILPLFGPFRATAESLGSDQVYLWSYGTNFLVPRRGWFPFSIFWSLAVEEHFYLAWPAAVLLRDRRGLKVVCLALIALAPAARVVARSEFGPLAPYTMTPCRMDALAVGAFLALVARGPGGLGAVARFARAAAIAGAAAVGGLFAWRSGLDYTDPVVSGLGLSLLAAWFGAVLVAVATLPGESPAARVVCCPALRALGRYSYGAYIANHLVQIVFDECGVPEAACLVIGSELPGRLATVALGIGLTFVVARASFLTFESHFNAMKERFPYGPRPLAEAPTMPPGTPAEIGEARAAGTCRAGDRPARPAPDPSPRAVTMEDFPCPKPLDRSHAASA